MSQTNHKKVIYETDSDQANKQRIIFIQTKLFSDSCSDSRETCGFPAR